jgi:hypothetical protein
MLGWFGSALLVTSLAQRSALRLHSLNLVSALALIAYNLNIHSNPQVALNGAVVLVNVWKIASERRSPRYFRATGRRWLIKRPAAASAAVDASVRDDKR